MEERIDGHAGEISLTLNGKPRSVRTGASLSDLIHELSLRERLVVVERNGIIVPRSAYGDTLLEDRDTLEIVHFVGGGV